MPGCAAYLLDITRAHALLDRDDIGGGRLGLAPECGHEGLHPRAREECRRALGYEGRARHDLMVVLGEEVDELAAKLIDGGTLAQRIHLPIRGPG